MNALMRKLRRFKHNSSKQLSLRRLRKQPRKEVRWDDIALSFERSMYAQRPSDDAQGREWDAHMGRSYRAMQNLPAWENLRDNLLALRDEQMVRGMDGSDRDAALALRTVVAVEAILKMPTKFAEEGKMAQRILEEIRSLEGGT